MTYSSLSDTQQALDQDTNLQQSNHNRKIKILFFTSSLGSGGAEMHLVRLVNSLDRNRFNVSVAVAQGGGSYEAALSEDVLVHSLNSSSIRSSTVRMIQAIAPLRKRIEAEQPDILCSVMDHANIAAILACRQLKIRPKILVCVQNPLSTQYHQNWHPVAQSMRFLIPLLYSQVDRIIALSQGVAEEIKQFVSGGENLTEVIYNAGVDDTVSRLAKEPLEGEVLRPNVPLVVACGRLHSQKGFSYLIDAFAQVQKVIPAHLWIVGEGSQRQVLEQQIQAKGLTDCVRLVGFQNNPYQYMATADVFVLSSVYEGFGNVIVEAMACGTPVIATNCPYGPAEIIQDGVNGILVPPGDVNSLSQAIIQVLMHTTLRQQLSRNGQRRSQDFHSGSIASAYANSFLQVLS